MVKIENQRLIQIITISMLFIYGCQEVQIENNPSIYSKLRLELRDPTFYAELSSDSIYSDNIIYNSCNVIEYDYYFLNDGNKFKFVKDGFRDWSIATDSKDTSKKFVNKIFLHSYFPNPNYNNPPQTPIVYTYINNANEVVSTENTGVLENFKNIRIHIPRGGFFHQVFPLSWPSVKFPLNVNSTWEWKWKNNMATYSHQDFLQGDSIQEFIYTYKVTDELELEFEFAKVRCFEITVISRSLNDEYICKYYFNSKLGFLKMVFVLSETKKVVLFATDYINRCNEEFNGQAIDQIITRKG